MSKNSETFGFVYSVTDNDGRFTIGSSAPVATGVTVTTEPVLSHHPHFSIDGYLEANGQFDPYEKEQLAFVSRADDGSGDQGFIARDSTGHYFFFTQDQLAGSDITLHREHGGEHICFMPGTRIATPAGETPVETLAIGDLVLTSDGAAVAVRWIGRQTISRLFTDELRLPVCVKAGAFADAVPRRDLHLSPDHALLVDGVLAHAGSLVNDVSIVRSPDLPTVFTYYHIEVASHALILAENTPAETFIDNVSRMNFDNWREHEALAPSGAPSVEMAYPRAKAHRQVPRAIHDRLAERGAALHGAQSAAA
jgi:hypothetical protein